MEIVPVNNVSATELLDYFLTLVTIDKQRVERPEDVAKITLADEQRWIDVLTERTEKQEGASYCILSNERVIGLGEVERKSRWIERHVAELRFGILPNHKSEGKRLVDALASHAKEIGITTLYYFHLHSQTQGIEIITESSFSYAGKIRNYYKNADIYSDRVFYERLL